MKVREILIHTLVWMAFLAIITFWQWDIFSLQDSLIHASKMAVISIAVFYSNYYLLLPRLFAKGKTFYYVLSIGAILIGVYLIFELTKEWMPRPEFMNRPKPDEFKESFKNLPRMEPPKNMWTRMLPQTAAQTIPMLFFSSLLWFANENRQRKQKEVSLMNENLISEMRFLKSQINPHFLFNALNNIYSLAFRKSDHTPEMIMKLSEMLRHVVYDSSNSVSLSKEVSYIENYIDFQTLKLGDDKGVSFNHEGINDRLILEPMLLIPFIENSFKHSNIEEADDAFIEINLRTENSTIRLEVKNSFSETTQTKDHTPGIGMQNVRQRLNLVYPNRSELTQKVENGVFIVNVEIDTNA
ncbi:MAG: hypothetical protein CMB80_15700 [Flammeovirgaceae bacterium]|nr:hypothetical protein [Flammeovirgaceae bacterium]MBE61371.1 hypothetical protein [Flammeovirgaceae bacterium]MBR09495.1 hypothetical protein [Rickettsiales bacterium]HCX22722.1 hypothetical protein [Cytophagales bacterium]|tara:strand:+ start:3596 stop:4660 length:1065 start_codon:yes stop_codon:yes gene_type:complete